MNGLPGPGPADVGAPPRPRPPDRASTCPASSAASCPTPSGATRATRSTRRCTERRPRPAGHDGGAVRVRRHRARLDAWATTSTSPSARATCRPRRCRWRSPTRRSRTAARSCARTSAARSRTARAGSCRSCARRRAAQARHLRRRRVDDHGGPARRAASPGGTSARRLQGRRPRRSTARPARPSAGLNADQSWYVAFVPDAVAADRRRRDHRAGRLRRRDRGPGGAPDPVRPGSISRRTAATPATRAPRDERQDPHHPGLRAAAAAGPAGDPAADRPAAGAGRARARGVLGRRAQGRDAPTTSPAQPHYYVYRQIAFAGDRPRADVRCARGWTTRGCASCGIRCTAS